VSDVVIVDYDCGNLFSVKRAFEHSGASVTFSNDPNKISSANRLILPGVGAFGDAAKRLRDLELFEPILKFAMTQRPMLGICVGMQLLFDNSDEFGDHTGLGIIPGVVTEIPKTRTDGESHKIPHIGWNQLVAGEAGNSWDGTLLDGFGRPTHCYFVHSFNGLPTDPIHQVADCIYGGHRIAAMVRKDYITGCQFHPEKSGPQGLEIIRNFLLV